MKKVVNVSSLCKGGGGRGIMMSDSLPPAPKSTDYSFLSFILSMCFGNIKSTTPKKGCMIMLKIMLIPKSITGMQGQDRDLT